MPDFVLRRALDDDDLAREATITQRDRQLMLDFWRQYGTPTLVLMLTAREERT